MPNGLEIKFLGPPEVFYGGQPVKFATRKALALFAYLVVETGTHPREKLQTIFWPESETRLAQSALRSTLARIKNALREVNEPLRIEADQVGFNGSIAFTLDLDLVTQAVTDTAPKQIAPPMLSQFQNVVGNTRGPFLEAFSLPDAPAFNDWSLIQRNAWGRRLNLIYDRLSNHQLEKLLIEPAIETVTRWLVLDHLNESAHRCLMRLHFLHGDRSAALQTYETCRILLAQELGVEPSTETQKLLTHIHSSPILAPVADPDTQAREPLHIPFVGRSKEYQRLAHVFRLVKKDQPQVVVVSGESGMGKTRLSDEFLKLASIEGADILRGRAYETSGGLPYQPIIDALRERLERENAPEDLLDDVWLVELARILPELRERYPDLPVASSDESTARARLFEAIARLGLSLTARRPLVLLVDDLQWADPGTLEIIHYLASSWRTSHSPILLLILTRDESLAHGSTLRDWMSGLTRDIHVTRLALEPVQASAIQELVQALTGENTAGAADLSDWLTAETNGQPFFVVETLSALEDYGALVWKNKETSNPTLDPLATLANLKSMDSQSLAPSIHEVILSRLEWLSQTASVVLAAAAVIGRDCSFRRLSQVAGTDEQTSLDALDELLFARLITEARNEARPYIISHDHFRNVVYAQLSEARRRVFHRRALTALIDEKAPSAELARHALAAKDWQQAFHHSLLAGNEAMRLYDVKSAIKLYETAQSLLNENKVDADTETCQHLYTSLGRACEVVFRHCQALVVYEEMQSLASARGSQKMELAALVARCLVLPLPYDSQDIPLAEILTEKAAALAQTLGNPKAMIQIELSLASIHKFGDGQIEPTITHLMVAERLARQGGMPEQVGQVMMELGGQYMSLGQLPQAEAAFLSALEIFRELDKRPRIQDVLHALGMIQMEIGEFETALGYLDQAYLANETLGSLIETYALTVTRNVIHILRGEYDRVFESLLPAIELDESLIIPWLQVDIHQQLAWCYYDLGDYQAGLHHCNKAISYHTHVIPSARVPAFNLMAMLHIAKGELDMAAKSLEQGLKNFDLQHMAFPWWWESLSILISEAELALVQNQTVRAEACVEQLLGKYCELKFRHHMPGVLFLQARIAMSEGNTEIAYQSLMDALKLSDEMGTRREVWAICWELRELEIERGNECLAIQLKERARNEVQHIIEHAGTIDLREIFLLRPDVHQMMDTA